MISPWGRASRNIQFLFFLLYKCYTDLPNSSQEEDVNVRRTTDDDGHQRIAIGHLSDPRNIKIEIFVFSN